MLNSRTILMCTLALAHCMASIMSASSAAKSNQVQTTGSSGPVDCDSYFSDVVQIDEKMMNEFHDQELRHAYGIRNKNMGLCLEFYTKFLAKLDFYLNSLDALEIESDEEEPEEYEYVVPEKRQARNKLLKSKHFW